MGADIHIYVVKDKKVIADDLYDGRHYEWFDNLTGRGNSEEYDHLETLYGISPQAPDEFNEKYTKENCYYGFYYISVGDFKKWYQKYQPCRKAGWASTWEAWAIENKGLVPEYLSRYKEGDDQIFVEYTDLYEPSRHIYEYLMDNRIDDDADLTYFFDC